MSHPVQDVGPWLLGALDPREDAAAREHVRSCARCGAEAAHLRPVADLLARVPADVARGLVGDGPGSSSRAWQAMAGGGGGGGGGGDTPATGDAAEPAGNGLDPHLLPLLLRAASAESRRVRVRRAVGALAIAAAAVLVVLFVVRPAAVTPPGTAAAAVELLPVGSGPSALRAQVTLEQAPWGTQLEVHCRYADDGYGARSAPVRYGLVVHGTSGEVEQVATWLATPGEDVAVPAATDLARPDVVRVDLVSAAGDALLTADLG